MKIKHSGKYIVLENEYDWTDIQTIRCVCGHDLADHEYHFLPSSTNTIEVTNCKRSTHCAQFRIPRTRLSSLNVSYAQSL